MSLAGGEKGKSGDWVRRSAWEDDCLDEAPARSAWLSSHSPQRHMHYEAT